jgi:hypothetical protein
VHVGNSRWGACLRYAAQSSELAVNTNKLRMRLWLTSLIAGCTISAVLTAFAVMTRTAFYFPLFWPGLFFAWIVTILIHGESMPAYFGIVIAAVGNAALYVWACLRVIKAEMLAGGRVGRYLNGDSK